MRPVLLSLAALLASAHASAQTSLIRDLRGSPDDLISVYGEPDEVIDGEPYDSWLYPGADEGIARSYSIDGMRIAFGIFTVVYADESAAYARVFALQDALSELGSMAEREWKGIYTAFGVGEREAAGLNVMRYPEVRGQFSYHVRLTLMNLPPSATPEPNR